MMFLKMSFGLVCNLTSICPSKEGFFVIILFAEAMAVASMSEPVNDQPYSIFPIMGYTQLAPVPMSKHFI